MRQLNGRHASHRTCTPFQPRSQPCQQPRRHDELCQPPRGVVQEAPVRSETGAREGLTAAVQDPLLLRVARGEAAERTPVWLMRQAGRYMADFRKYSSKYGFRQRSETPDIAIELSLQPWRAFCPDGIIMFSDILTPLPALGIEFDVVPGIGPVIPIPIRSAEAVSQMHALDDPATQLPFIAPLLQALRAEAGSAATVLGFVGAPWTLAAYCVEGGSKSKDCRAVKGMMLHDPALLHDFLGRLAEALIVYVCHQIDAGAQVVQLFESWANRLTPAQAQEFSLPYMERIVERVHALRPGVPIVLHCNGGTGKLELLRDTAAEVVGLDWACDMAVARATLGPGTVVQGNVDPLVLFGPEDAVRAEVAACLRKAGPRGHILNLGHGVVQGTPEDAVALFCQLARESGGPVPG